MSKKELNGLEEIPPFRTGLAYGSSGRGDGA